jgi:hypothetical protein
MVFMHDVVAVHHVASLHVAETEENPNLGFWAQTLGIFESMQIKGIRSNSMAWASVAVDLVPHRRRHRLS